MQVQETTTRDRFNHYPVRIIVRISQRQADDMAEIKKKTNLTDSDIVRESLQIWLNDTLNTIKKAG